MSALQKRVLVLSHIVWLSLSNSASGAGPEEAQRDRQARLFAPILWLSMSEPAYPMLPHPFAFDGIDNNCDTRIDLEDPAEVRMDLSVEELVHAFREARLKTEVSEGEECVGPWRAFGPAGPGRGRARSVVKPQARVLVVEAADRDYMGWNKKRSAVPAMWDPDIPVDTALIQYWFYYPFDVGPGWHRHDAEHASIFISTDARDPSRRLRGVVGAGHESNNVNNMLIADSGGVLPHLTFVPPARLPNHIPILVELGKHASAPDLNCDGRFDLGADSNVYSESTWGSRDIWSGSEGKALKVGRFESWYSLPRVRSDRLFVHEWWKDEDDFKLYQVVCPDLVRDERGAAGPRPNEGSRDSNVSGEGALATAQARPSATVQGGPVEAFAQRLKGIGLDEKATPVAGEESSGEASRKAAFEGTPSYQLFRVSLLYQLQETLKQCTDDERACGESVREFLLRDENCEAFFWGLPESYCQNLPEIGPEVARAMKEWVAPFRHSDRANIWEHEAFREPKTVFRPWLFQRLGLGLEVGRSDSGNAVIGVIGRIADVPLADSRLEIYAYFDNPFRDAPLKFHRLGFDFHPSRTSLFGPYFGLGYARSAERHLTVSAGGEVFLPNLPHLPRKMSVSFYAGLTGQVLRSTQEHKLKVNSVPTVVPLQETDPVRVQFGLRIVYGFWGPRHPLAR